MAVSISLLTFRNKAKTVEDNVDGVVENIGVAKKALQEAGDKIRGSSLSLQQIQDRVLEVRWKCIYLSA